MVVINRERLVRQFMEFVQIDSPSLAEAPFVSSLAEELKNLGLSVENDRTGRNDAGNLFTVLPGTNQNLRPILLSMHTDTVEPGRGIKPRLEGTGFRVTARPSWERTIRPRSPQSWK